MGRILEIIEQIVTIFKKHHLTKKQRILLWWAYIKLVLKRFFIGRLPGINETTTNFLGYTVKLGKFTDFYWTFIEVFIKEEYLFSSQSKTPFILDCGGNIGITTLYFKWLFPNCSIIVFEPEPFNLKILRSNIKNNRLNKVTLVEAAVGSREGTMVLTGSHRAATLHPERTGIDKEENLHEVKVVALSNYIDNNEVDFIKMDIEGAEDDVISELASSKKLQLVKSLTLEYHKRETEPETRFKALCDTLVTAQLFVEPTEETLHPKRMTHVMVHANRQLK